MPIATLQTTQEIHTSNFGVTVTLDMPIEALPKSIVTLRAVLGHGISGVDFSVSGSGTTWNLMFTIPAERDGIFEISLNGEVTVVGESMPEAVTVTQPLLVRYDTTTAVSASWGDIDYRDGGVIVLPVVFGEEITHLHKSDFTLTRDEGAEVWEVVEDYWLVQRVGVARTFYLHFQISPEKKGRFSVELTGYVWKTATTIRDNVMIDRKVVPYGTIVPKIVDYEIPGSYTFGENFDVLVEFNTLVTGWHLNNTFAEIWIEEGARLGTPVPYKWTGANPPDIHAAVPDDPTTTDWQILQAAPEGHRGEWHGEEGQFFLMRIAVTNASAAGIAQFTLHPENPLRGPVS